MAKIPKEVVDTDLSRKLSAVLGPAQSGKVRDSYDLPNFPDFFLSVVTDRMSAFDVVWPILFPNKGYILNFTDMFWDDKLFRKLGIATDMVAGGPAIDLYLPADLRGDPDRQSRATIRRRHNMILREFVFRDFITGTGWDQYQKTGMICGSQLPEGLKEGDRIPTTFTPTDKSQTGHDLPLDASSVEAEYPLAVVLCRLAFSEMSRHAAARGLLLVDGKFELGWDMATGLISFCDEKGTCDSSRYWEEMVYRELHPPGKLPLSKDKQFFRNFLKTVKTSFGTAADVNPQDDSQVEEAWQRVLEEPTLAEMVKKTSNVYLEFFELLVGNTLDTVRKGFGINF